MLSPPKPTGRRLSASLVVLFLLLIGFQVDWAQANPSLPTDLSYDTETTWLLPGLPDLDATSGFIPHNFSHGEAVFETQSDIIHGFRPGKAYSEMVIRDIAWGMETAQYYYPENYLREPIEAFLRRQYSTETVSIDGDFGVRVGAGAIGGIITPEGHSNKQTITSDEETSLLHAAYLYYQMTYNTAWLEKEINGQSIISRLNQAADWLFRHRLDPQFQLLWRGHTTDWGDVKFEKGPGPTDYNPSQDHKTVSIYDQALAYMTLLELAEMNAAVGNTEKADKWQAAAETLKTKANEQLWQPDRGFYLTHAHITSLTHPFEESGLVSISNALAVYTRLADIQHHKTIFKNLDRAQTEAGVSKPGLSIYPFYPTKGPNQFFDYPGMGIGNHQNGGVWDWWGGVQIKAEFLRGYSAIAQTHLLQVANEWQKHPGNIIEWQSSTDPRFEGSHYYSAAAGTMGSAIIEGFFGIVIDGQGLTLQPRLGLNDGYIRVYQEATDRYAAYSYDWGQQVTRLDYGTNASGAVRIKVLKLRSEQVSQITIDGNPVDFVIENVGEDTYLTFEAPGGRHSVEITKGGTLSQSAAQPTRQAPAGNDPGAIVRNSIQPRLTPPDGLATPDNSTQQAYQSGSLLSAPLAKPRITGRSSILGILQFTSAVMVFITSVGLILLVILRKRVGLSYSDKKRSS